jgi:hypothetical protein
MRGGSMKSLKEFETFIHDKIVEGKLSLDDKVDFVSFDGKSDKKLKLMRSNDDERVVITNKE